MTRLRTALLLFTVLASGCVDYGIDEEKFICRAQAECGAEQKCVRGPGCYCVCVPTGQQANMTCDDPECADPVLAQ
jgi:hypothetical protein